MIRKILKEARPATLVVALISTTLGISAAYRQGYIFHNIGFDLWRIFMLTFGGIFLQSGTNLINNFFEEELISDISRKRTKRFMGYKRSPEEILFFKTGLIFLGITALIGLWLSFYSGLQLFIIEVIGLFCAYAYSGEPFKYKNYGLGALMSFIMMGPLMTYASFYVFSHSFSIEPILYTLSLGLFIPAILMANELRDYDEDKRKGIGTLTVRIGFNNGKIIYYTLIVMAYVNTLLLIIFKVLPLEILIVFSTAIVIKKVKLYMGINRKLLIAQTAKTYLLFGVEFIIVLFLK